MSDLEPDLHTPVLEDPSITRLMLRRADDGRCGDLLDRAGAVATSMSVVVPGDGASAEQAVAAMGQWRPEHARVEVLVAESGGVHGRSVVRERLARCGHPWRVITSPPGGRAAAMAAGAVAAEHEFVLVGTGGHPRFELVEQALSWMWADGADVALIERELVGVDVAAEVDESDPAGELTRWLGLSGVVPEGRMVVMRRWVARWLFNEITRAISPAEEVADRTRLLGIGIVHLASFSDDGFLHDR